jgi:hypothetical protein
LPFLLTAVACRLFASSARCTAQSPGPCLHPGVIVVQLLFSQNILLFSFFVTEPVVGNTCTVSYFDVLYDTVYSDFLLQNFQRRLLCMHIAINQPFPQYAFQHAPNARWDKHHIVLLQSDLVLPARISPFVVKPSVCARACVCVHNAYQLLLVIRCLPAACRCE